MDRWRTCARPPADPEERFEDAHAGAQVRGGRDLRCGRPGRIGGVLLPGVRQTGRVGARLAELPEAYAAAVLRHAPEDIRRQLATEGARRPQYVEHVVGIYRSWQQLVSFWLVAPPVVAPAAGAVEEVAPKFHKDQAAAFHAIMASVRQTATAGEAAVPFVLQGAAGTGKSFVIAGLVQACLAQGYRVHLCALTGALTQQYRAFVRPGACSVDGSWTLDGQ